MTERLSIGIVGCGDLGTALGEQLVDAGHSVVGIRRRSDKLPESFTRISADIASHEGWKNVPKQIDRWVYALAADDRSAEAYERAYELGTQRLVDHLGGERAGRVIFVSSTSVYEFEDGREVTEDTDISPTGMSGATMRRGEKLVASLQGTSLRLGGIYGAGRHWLVRAVQEGRAALKPGEPRYTNRIHRDDAVGLLHAMTVAEVERLPPIVLGVDDLSAPWNDVITYLANALGRELSEDGVGRAPSGARRATNKRCRSLHRATLGYTLCYPTYREGYSAVLRAMGLVND